MNVYYYDDLEDSIEAAQTFLGWTISLPVLYIMIVCVDFFILLIVLLMLRIFIDSTRLAEQRINSEMDYDAMPSHWT